MSPSRCPAVDASHRVRVLRALGVVLWTRRVPAGAAVNMVEEVGIAAPLAAPGSCAACAVVLAHDCSSRALDLLGRALNAGGPVLARAGRIRLGDNQVVEIPAAATYLVFGQAQAEALRRTLRAEVVHHAQIVVVNELESVLADAGAKRRLWSALRGLRVRLAVASG